MQRLSTKARQVFHAPIACNDNFVTTPSKPQTFNFGRLLAGTVTLGLAGLGFVMLAGIIVAGLVAHMVGVLPAPPTSKPTRRRSF